MVYIKDWPEFQQRSIKLYQKEPLRTRYLIKSRPSTLSLTLKVTDDVTTIKFRTKSSAILGRLEIFNKAMTLAIAGHPRPLEEASGTQDAATSTSTAATTAAQHVTQNQTATSASATTATPSSGTNAASSSDKKKKKKKGKK